MRRFLLLFLAFVACNRDVPGPSTGVDTPDSGHADVWVADSGADVVVADTGGGGGDTSDAGDAGDGPDTSVPLIDSVLTCGRRADVGGVPRGSDLVRHTLDTQRFPDALCNDGSPAVMYFRPYQGEANRDKWVIQLKGGGGCGSGPGCAQRWCNILTFFGKTQMVDDINDPPLPAIGGQGILSRRSDNPWGDYNHVYVQYCSSDGWSGTHRDKIVETFHPCDPEAANATCPSGEACPADGDMAGLCADQPVTFRMHFLGSRIVDAVLTTLRQDDVDPLMLEGVTMPDLDDAEHVVFAGASAGGEGVMNNLDRVNELLRANNAACQGGSCPLVVDGVIDSIFMPSFEGLDFTQVPTCSDPALCTWENWIGTRYATRRDNPFYTFRTDASCETWHLANEPGTEARCIEDSHVISHHLTTPFFLRMGLVDELFARDMLSVGLATSTGEPIDTPIEFAALMHPQLEWFSRWADEAEEADTATIAPAVFGPGCPKHETLSSEADTFDATVEFQGMPRDQFAVWDFWKLGGAMPAVLVADTPMDSVCP